MRKSIVIAFVASGLFAAACSASDEPPVEDPLAIDEESDLQDQSLGKADDVNNTYTFFRVRTDYRRCVSPLCGGYWVSRANRYWTKCSNGSWKRECYVADIDLDEIPFSNEEEQAATDAARAGTALLRGSIVAWEDANFGELGRFSVQEVWAGVTGNAPEGLFTKIADNGIRCFTTPCASVSEYKLNSHRFTNLDETDFSLSGATEAQKELAYQAIGSGNGIMSAGYRYYWYGEYGWAKGRAVVEFYLHMIPEPQPEPAPVECFVGGCSSQYCSAQDGLISTCEWREEYACYRTATCEQQPNGDCGWTPTAELNQCLADAN